MFFRQYVSSCAARKGNALLDSVGLEPKVKAFCYADNPSDEQQAVQSGLVKWRDADGDRATWLLLLDSMKFAQIGVQYINELKEKLLEGAVILLDAVIDIII